MAEPNSTQQPPSGEPCDCKGKMRFIAGILLIAIVAVSLLQAYRSKNAGAGDDGVVAASEEYPFFYRLTGDRFLVGGTTMGRIPFSATITRGDLDEQTLLAAAGRMWGALDRVDTLMNAYNPASDLGRVNAAAAGEPVQIDPQLTQLLVRSHALSEATDGAFDPTGRPLFRLWASAGKNARVPTDDEIASVLAHCGWSHFAIDAEKSTVTKDDSLSQIDLGAIAKGYAADKAIAAAYNAAAGVQLPGVLIEVGGELAIRGRSPSADGQWTIGVNDPFEPTGPDGSPNICGKMRLKDFNGTATSGDYMRFSEIDGIRYSHILDPRSGRPVEHIHSVTVVADSCELADAMATALSVLGPWKLVQLCQSQSVEAMMITGEEKNTQIVFSDNFTQLLSGGKLAEMAKHLQQ